MDKRQRVDVIVGVVEAFTLLWMYLIILVLESFILKSIETQEHTVVPLLHINVIPICSVNMEMHLPRFNVLSNKMEKKSF
jgi:hypothetical protein